MPYLHELFRVAARVVGDRSEAEDLIQETYLQAWKSFHRFEPGTNCRAWLFKILFHVTQQQRRKRSKLGLAGDIDQKIEETVGAEPPVPQHISDEDVLAALG